MENEFKVPSLEAKIKFAPPKQDKAKNPNDETEIDSPSGASVNKPAVKDEKKPLIQCSYIAPKWSSEPSSDEEYSFEVLKNGTIVENVSNLQSKAYWLMGKMPDNHIPMAHPTISRYHAVLQYRPDVPTKQKNDSDSDEEEEANKADTSNKPQVEKGWYLYDLSSTHGSFVNKQKIPTKTYVRVRVGYMLKFGASTRSYILQGPDCDAEAQSELTITEVKEMRRQKEEERLEREREHLRAEEELQKAKEAQGISWGMEDDAEEETDLSHNPYAASNNEELFLTDPKKTLRGFFEREGFDLEYKVDEMSTGTFACKVELPVADSNGRNVVAEVCHKGKKKECVLQCALEACRILDRHGVLRKANHEPLKRRKVESSDDEDDEFYDRTAEAEAKRKRKVEGDQNTAKTYDELLEDEKSLLKTISDAEAKIVRYQELTKLAKQQTDDGEDLDDFMLNLSNEKRLDKTQIRKLRFDVQGFKADHIKLQRLIKIARPIELPPLQDERVAGDTQSVGKKKLVLPLFGKKGTFKFSAAKSTVKQEDKVVKTKENERGEEFEEEEDDETNRKSVVEDAEKDDQVVTEKSVKDLTSKAPESIESRLNEVEPPTRKKLPRLSPPPSYSDTPIEQAADEDEEMLSDSEQPTNSKLKEITETAVDKLSAKKKRNRPRHRGDKGRDNNDADETGEVLGTEKYSGWVPPQNQSGDGMTNLNSKYGY